MAPDHMPSPDPAPSADPGSEQVTESVETPDPQVVLDVFGEGEPLIRAYADILATRGIEWGLIGPRERPRLWQRHIFNCAAMTALLPQGATVCDVGSGAGLPGLVLAIARPDVHVSLVEPLQRRVTFLEQAADELALTDTVTVTRARAEDIDPGAGFDVVTSRAVGALTKLIAWCADLPSASGEILALKGESAAREIDKAAKELRKKKMQAELLQVRAHPSTEPTSVVRVRRSP